VETLEQSANQFVATRISYDKFKQQYGELIFGGMQPKRALDAVRDKLTEDGFFLKTGTRVKDDGRALNGFMIQRIDTTTAEQTQMGA